MNTVYTLHRGMGALLLSLGSLVLYGWATHNATLVQIYPGLVAMVVNTAFCFCLAGTGLLLWSGPQLSRGRRHALYLIGGLLLVLPGNVLLQHLFNSSWGGDWSGLHAWLQDDNPRPGRMASNTAVGFMLAGLVFLLLPHMRHKIAGVSLQLLTFALLAIGTTGLVGYWLHIDSLYGWFHSVRMALHTACGMMVLATGLWASWHRELWTEGRSLEADGRITLASTAVLSVIAVTTGLAGFAVLQHRMEASYAEGLAQTLKTRVFSLNAMAAKSVGSARRIALRDDVVAHTRELLREPGNEVAIQALRRSINNLMAVDYRGIALFSPEGKSLFSAGRMSPEQALSLEMMVQPAAWLKWDGVHLLSVDVPVVDGGIHLATLRLERPTAALSKLFLEQLDFGATGEMAVCVERAAVLHCFPQARNPKVFTIQPVADGGPQVSMYDAIAGRAGWREALDYRRQKVLAAYAPLGVGGGMVVKQDAAEVYAPIASQLALLLPLLLLMVVGGAVLLRTQVRPLARRLVESEADARRAHGEAAESQARISAIVRNIGEGLITMSEQGVIESFNPAASEIFGYRPEEILGCNVKQLLPPHLHEAHERGMQRYRTTRECRMLGSQGIELPGVRKDGSVFDMELAVNVVEIEQRLVFVGIVRDISLRKQAEMALFTEKERLHTTLESIADAVITTDIEGRIGYMNPVAERMTGWSTEEAAGRPLEQVFNIVNARTRDSAVNPVQFVLSNGESGGLAPDNVLIRRDGFEYAIDDSASPIRNHEGVVIGVVLVFHDVTEARQMAERMSHQASHDALTGLINRRELERRLGVALEATHSTKGNVLLYLDMDQFKLVNDTCGHIAGDELLKQVTVLLQDQLRDSDVLARLGGDEFAVLLENCPLEPAQRVAEALRQTVSGFHFVWEDKSFGLSVSIGLVAFMPGEMNLAGVLMAADSACYVAKDKGRNRIYVYEVQDAELKRRHGEMGWVSRIQSALQDSRFCLYAQPIVEVSQVKEEFVHFELLIRMRDEQGEMVPPMAFIPAAERYNLMPQIDRWVISHAFGFLKLAHQGGNTDLRFAINLSGASLNDESLFAYIMEQFELHGIPRTSVCFEITETSAISNLAQASRLIAELRNAGCQFSLDDFGSGMSSFAYLKHLPVDFLKIDGGFVKDMAEDPIDHAMVEAINNIGHVMGIKTIAEFVENDRILECLHLLGVNYAQGYGISKPFPLEELAKAA